MAEGRAAVRCAPMQRTARNLALCSVTDIIAIISLHEVKYSLHNLNHMNFILGEPSLSY